MTPEYLIILARWGVNVAFWPAIAFTALSGLVWPWWKTFWGVNIVVLELAIALALLSSVLSTDFNVHVANNVVVAWTVICALWLVGFIIVWRGFLVISSQLHGTFGTGIFGMLRRLKNARSRCMLFRKPCSRCDGKRKEREKSPS